MMAEQEASSQGMTSTQQKNCNDIISKIKANRNSYPFLEPVDPIKLNIPDYFDKIKTPMDLSTIKSKLDSKKYETIDDFKDDMELMLNNCFTYNLPETYVYKCGQEIQKLFNTLYDKKFIITEGMAENKKRKIEDRKRPSKTTRSPVFDKCNEILLEIMKAKYKKFTWPFLEPVDTVLVPNYLSVIKTPIDLSTIRTKLISQNYDTISDFEADLRLMVNNCFTFNPKGSEIYECGVGVSNLLDELFIVDKNKKIAELKKKIAMLQKELKTLEGDMVRGDHSTEPFISNKTYSIAERIALGNRLLKLNEAQSTQIAEIIGKGVEDLDIGDKDEIEIDLKTLPDAVIGEIERYLKILNDEISSDEE
ncbi:SWR1 complex bromodomain subunit bdf1 [Astathelohania contejeani]|uniref:SWR1 complex bromodomain subunit bdf1 n=1 Tax=Astathelohania contejeani TaxID=164912 RepID=A0ABQ7HZ99_9MICR|nr:SWR1 complex bromodomain subunit bdf1 [Thelohania contejeani]